MEFTAQLTLESKRGRDKQGNPMVLPIDASAFAVGGPFPLIRGMNLRDLIGTATITAVDEASISISGFIHADALPDRFLPAGTVLAFRDDPDAGRVITAFALAAIAVPA